MLQLVQPAIVAALGHIRSTTLDKFKEAFEKALNGGEAFSTASNNCIRVLIHSLKLLSVMAVIRLEDDDDDDDNDNIEKTLAVALVDSSSSSSKDRSSQQFFKH
ncbi:hypothetical protein RIF29_28029 [Crotalaria pallida]|uniref:Uncharacterized protein n=1 Tax=Crotalaria pallida TaxID=3830 RepID=A0AAN9EQW1_CROPI